MSILELIFVMAIMAITAGVTIPSAQSAIAAYRLESSSMLITSQVARARSEALKRNRAAWVLLDKAARTAVVQTTDAGGAVVNVAGVTRLPATVAFTGMAGATANVRFDSMGRLVLVNINPPQTVRLRSERLGTQRVVTVAVTGRITVT